MKVDLSVMKMSSLYWREPFYLLLKCDPNVAAVAKENGHLLFHGQCAEKEVWMQSWNGSALVSFWNTILMFHPPRKKAWLFCPTVDRAKWKKSANTVLFLKCELRIVPTATEKVDLMPPSSPCRVARVWLEDSGCRLGIAQFSGSNDCANVEDCLLDPELLKEAVKALFKVNGAFFCP